MDENIQKIIAEQMKSLPKDVVTAILSVDFKDKLQEITARQKLLIDQAAKLEMETTLVMIGLEPLNDYVNNLQRELSIPSFRANEIAQDVSENIFKPIRDSLKKINLGLAAADEEEVTKFTNSNEESLNRDQILNEIENPSTIGGGARTIEFTPVNTTITEPKSSPINQIKPTEIEIRPAQEIQIRDNSTKQTDSTASLTTKDIGSGIVESKMTGTTITPQQVVKAVPEIKLPEAEKKRPSSGVDPYREAIM